MRNCGLGLGAGQADELGGHYRKDSAEERTH